MNSTGNTPINNLIIFLKHPKPGKVKTRLASSIGDEKAAKIYKDIAEEIILNCIGSDEYSTSLYCYPPNNIYDIKKWINQKELQYYPQLGADLGGRMLNAVHHSLILGYKNIILIGSDCIDIDRMFIEDAFSVLSKNEIIIGPSNDGGYYLIGLNKKADVIFNNMKWSNSNVLKETIKRLDEKGYIYHLLNYLDDIDTIDDLRRSNKLRVKYDLM